MAKEHDQLILFFSFLTGKQWRNPHYEISINKRKQMFTLSIYTKAEAPLNQSNQKEIDQELKKLNKNTELGDPTK